MLSKGKLYLKICLGGLCKIGFTFWCVFFSIIEEVGMSEGHKTQ